MNVVGSTHVFLSFFPFSSSRCLRIVEEEEEKEKKDEDNKNKDAEKTAAPGEKKSEGTKTDEQETPEVIEIDKSEKVSEKEIKKEIEEENVKKSEEEDKKGDVTADESTTVKQEKEEKKEVNEDVKVEKADEKGKVVEKVCSAKHSPLKFNAWQEKVERLLLLLLLD